jgi:lipopolysaccharide/colanic/teichoic acid biosynthesis glycosyltransferase
MCVPEGQTTYALGRGVALPKVSGVTAVNGGGVAPAADGWAGARNDGPDEETTASRVYLSFKVAAEWLLALALCVLTAPLVALLAGLVKLTSPGPALYLQTRLGRGGRSYKICKLRTMAHNCEASTGAVWATKDDVRITPLGRILRMTHMDELPQLWNVLKGEMSLIGPRPERPEMVCRIERELPRYRERLQVRPGVTGLAQMRLPADTDLESVRRKLEHDLYYIQNVSFMMDLRIAVCTAFYFVGAAAEAVCDAAVGPYAAALKRQLAAEADVRETIAESAPVAAAVTARDARPAVASHAAAECRGQGAVLVAD